MSVSDGKTPTWRIGLAFAFLLLIAAEVVARLCGFAEPLLYEKTGYGYRVAPNQHLQKFGNAVDYNAQGMRSPAIDADPAAATLRVLCVGDSITNGGNLTDQTRTYPYLLAGHLSEAGITAEVLNVSAGGWAPANEEGWLRTNGIFGSKLVILQIASHDLFQPMAGSDLVDAHPSFPSRPPLLALIQVVERHVLPRLGMGPEIADPGAATVSRKLADTETALATFTRIDSYVRSRGAQLSILFIEQPADREPRDDFTANAKKMLAQWASAHGVALIATATELEARGGERMFRDGLHPNEPGNALIADMVSRYVIDWQRQQGAPPG